MVVHMCRPCPVERDEAPSVDGATEYVFWHEFAFRPEQRLSCPRLSVFSLAHVAKPFVVRIVRQPAVLQPFVDELVRRVVVQRR